MATVNLLLSAGILFTGNSYGSVASYNKTQTSYLFPTTEHQAQTLSGARNKEVVAGGDGGCDSPGHSVKYGTYSRVDTESSKVLYFSLLQVTEVKNSNGMELEGLKLCIDHLQEKM